MFDTLDFAQIIFAQEISADRRYETLGLPSSNRQHLATVVSYQHLTDGWNEDNGIASTHQTVTIALDIALLLTAAGQVIYHTSLGPNGEIMINLRNEGKSAELLAYPNGRNKFVRIGPDEPPQQGALTPESLRETLQWLNR
ncbi:hypothetical protein [Spirosoma validum]|uniref:Uncharacterized protein n=1 Tax=Spirosoma validum TaxID=2771355 RepID=A0A927B787_9BACT|nr:hypothetical protein [Spirosoma validum]MBD2756995.1 hypothetical protein [Spirosoma validum]